MKKKMYVQHYGPMNMFKEFNEYLKQHCRCTFDNRFLLAVSGGIDSMVMMHLFHQSGLEFSIAHCNFQLRGKESDDDQHFVEQIASQLKTMCYIRHFKTNEHAKSQGISVQMAARDLRYKWFKELCERNHFDCIAVGHNRDDMVETFLLNFARGTGIKGLTGIKPRQDHIIRPLLFATRKDITTFAKSRHISWRNDSSNADTKYDRNKIRHTLIPEFEKVYPAFRQNTINTISHLRQAEELYNHAIDQIRKAVCIDLNEKFLVDIEKLLEFPAIETILFELLREFGCNESMIHSLKASLDGESGKQVITATHTITRDRHYLIATKNTEPNDIEIIIEQDTTEILYPFRMNFDTLVNEGTGFTVPENRNKAALDLDLILYPLKIRRWRPGDWFRPLGMDGRKKISDFLVDQKIPLPDKQHIWLVESDGNIIWLINYRIDNRYKITESTRNILLIQTS